MKNNKILFQPTNQPEWEKEKCNQLTYCYIGCLAVIAMGLAVYAIYSIYAIGMNSSMMPGSMMIVCIVLLLSLGYVAFSYFKKAFPPGHSCKTFESYQAYQNIRCLFGERYQMSYDQPAQIDCRVTTCQFYKDAGRCQNVSPAITLTLNGHFWCKSSEVSN